MVHTVHNVTNAVPAHPLDAKITSGILFVLSGPSGVGKGTLCDRLITVSPELVYSVSATTRTPRSGEKDGIHYFFKTREQFQAMIQSNELLEWAEYVGNYYGTPKSFVFETLQQGQDVILEIEVQGALQVKQQFPEAILLFVLPPSLEELQQRIINRGTDSENTIRKRMKVAAEELKLMNMYDYAVVNDDLNSACMQIKSIVTAEHSKAFRLSNVVNSWLEGV
jgi:guanylate kinase